MQSKIDRYYHILIWSLVALIYLPVFQELYTKRWEFIDYTHAYFILPVSLFLVWSKKDSLKKIPVTHKTSEATIGLSLIVLGALMLDFGWKREYQLVSTLSLIPLLFGMIYYLCGSAFVKALTFPILYLLLLVPPPLGVLDSITLPMRFGASIATEHILKLFNYPISREGLLLSIGGQQVYLGEACSGFRSLITLASLGLAYIYISKNSLLNKGLMSAAIAPLALAGNLIRVVSVVLVTYYLGVTKGQAFFHDFSGFVMFAIMIGGLVGVESLLNKKNKR